MRYLSLFFTVCRVCQLSFGRSEEWYSEGDVAFLYIHSPNN